MSHIWTLLRLSAMQQPRFLDHVRDSIPGVETYVPSYQRLTRPHGLRRPIPVPTPIYPGYIFTHLDPDLVPLRSLTSTPIKAFYVRFGQKISTIPEPVITELKRLERLGLLIKETHRENPYQPGRKIRVHTPIADLNAVIIHLVGMTRVRVDTPIGQAIVSLSSVMLVESTPGAS